MPNNLISITSANIVGLLYETENADNPDNLTVFSTPGSTGANSTYAFGPLQIDTGGNKVSAGPFLENNGFTATQVQELENQQTVSSDELNTLNAELDAIPTATMANFQMSMVTGYETELNNVLNALSLVNPEAATAIENSPDDQLALVDYMNQYPGGITITNKDGSLPKNGMLAYLEGQTVYTDGAPQGLTLGSNDVTTADISAFVSTTAWSVQNPSSSNGRADKLQTALYAYDFGNQVLPAGYDGYVGSAALDLEETALGLTGDITSSIDSSGDFILTGSNGSVSQLVSGLTSSIPTNELNVYSSNSNFNFAADANANVYGSTNNLQCGANGDINIFGSNNFLTTNGGTVSALQAIRVTRITLPARL